MGISIHYRGRIDKVVLITKLTDELEDFAKSLGWRTRRWKEDFSIRNTARISRERGRIRIVGHAPLQGISLLPHKDCEPLWLTFDPNGYLVDVVTMAMVAQGAMKPEMSWRSTKTQFAPIEVHIGIVKLLQYVRKRYIANLEVDDDGGYWESGNAFELKRRFDSINRALDILQTALSANQSELSGAKSLEELAQMMERLFKKALRGKS
jgi:hypothetical protein